MGSVKRILLVEDDALVASIYRQKLADADFDVQVAEDGVIAMKLLPEFKPDLVVLDLLIPRLTGLDVLKYIRQHPELKSIGVIVFSNAFLPKLWEQVGNLGVDEMLLKSAVTPSQLIESISKTLRRIAGAVSAPPVPSVAPEPAPGRGGLGPAQAKPKSAGPSETTPEFQKRMRREFFGQIPSIIKKIQSAGAEFADASASRDPVPRLENLRRKIGFLTHMTSMAGCYRIAQLSSAFEALLFELQLKPEALNSSVQITITSTVALLTDCLGRAFESDEQCLSPTTVLVVEDDAVSSRALVMTLNRANLKASSVQDPFRALEMLRESPYDVAILDINLPGMSGISLCQRMRELHLHRKTPVIFVTGHSEFEPRARAILNGGDDIICKPIMPIELTVKVIAHLLKGRMEKQAVAL
jgi:DNA-binding response OmpR family regulator